MKQDIKERWLAAIPNYKKSFSSLKNQGRYCALGVLCDLYRKEVGGKWFGDRFSVSGDVEKSEAYVLPPEVVKWAGCRSPYVRLKKPFPGPDGPMKTVAGVNDYADSWEPVLTAIRESL